MCISFYSSECLHLLILLLLLLLLWKILLGGKKTVMVNFFVSVARL